MAVIDIAAKITPVCVPIQITPVFRGYKLTYSGIGGLQCLDCGDAPGHDGGNALEDEVTPTPPRLRTWLALEMTNVIFEN